ncbi:MAG: trigger factor [Lachnospiraceae bacterium]|nr:trigger factor [Lachnospiraceae bacterium]
MNSQVEKLEHNMVRLTVTVPAEEFDKAYVQAYNKNKGKIVIQGFRKGHVPLQVVEKMYGPEMFYEDASDIAVNGSYEEALAEAELKPVSRPFMDIVKIEKGSDFIYTVDFAVKPPVELCEYKGTEVEKKAIEVSDEEIDAEIKLEQDKNAREVTVDRPAENGDIVVLDYAGTVDGVAFDGGTAENQTLTLGSGQFIPGFEDQLIGTKAGDEKDVNVTFPEAYHEKTLSGKDAVFACRIHEVKVREIPEVDDDFVADVSEFETVAEYREDIKKNITKRKEDADKVRKQSEIMDKLVEGSVIDVPEAMIDTRVDQIIEDQRNRMAYSGFSLEQYLQYMGINIETFRENTRPDALKNIKSTLILEAIAEKEGLEVTDEDMEEQFEMLGKAYGLSADKVKEFMGEDQIDAIREQVKHDKALNFIVDESVEVEKPAEEEPAVTEEPAPAEEEAEAKED